MIFEEEKDLFAQVDDNAANLVRVPRESVIALANSRVKENLIYWMKVHSLFDLVLLLASVSCLCIEFNGWIAMLVAAMILPFFSFKV